MIIDDIWFDLKDGQKALIRSPKEEDIQGMLDYLRICEERSDILQMELDFIEGNVRARHLYEKMGFRIIGVKPNAIRLPNGKLLNEYMMIREMGK